MEVETKKITLLNSRNYSTWKEDIKVLLMYTGCWGFAVKSEPALTAEASSKEKRDFNLRKDRAFATIYLNVEPEIRTLLTGITDAAEAWTKLKSQYEPVSRARIIQLLDDFFGCRYNPEEDIGFYAARLKNIAKQLSDCGHPILELYQGFQVIRFLPSEFQNIVQSIYRWPDKDFLFDKIVDELISEEIRIKQVKHDLNNTGNNSVGAAHSALKLNESGINSKTKNTKFVKRKYNFKKSENSKLFNDNANIRKNTKNSFITETSMVQPLDSLAWVFDTAATNHFCNNKALFSKYTPVDNTTMSLAVGEVSCPIEGVGEINLSAKIGGQIQTFTLKDVMYSPKLRRNLISGCRADVAGASYVGGKRKIWVHLNGSKLFYAKYSKGLYFFKPYRYYDKDGKVLNTSQVRNFAIEANVSAELWHKRFAHINQEYVINTSKHEAVVGLPVIKQYKEECKSCKIAKTRRTTFKSISSIRSSKPLELLHMDLCGPLPVVSNGGRKYFLTIIDDFSRKVSVYIVKHKYDVFEIFKQFQVRAERLLNLKILNIRTDNGLEFCHSKFNEYLLGLGIKAERTNIYSPEQNGVSERYNYTALDGVKALIHSSGLKNSFWAEALLCFTYTWNRVCHGKQIKTPFEKYMGRKPSVSHLKPFGCQAYVGIPHQKRRKLDMRAKDGIMVGYALKTRGYRIWLKDEETVIETSNVKFNEFKNAVEAVLDPPTEKLVPVITVREHITSGIEESEGENSESEESEKCFDDSTLKATQTPCEEIEWTRKAVPRPDGSRTDIYYGVENTNTRIRSFNDMERYCKANNIQFRRDYFNFSGKNDYTGKVSQAPKIEKPPEANHVEIKIPQNFKQSVNSLHAEEWKLAMQSEMDVMINRQVWELVSPPKGSKILGNRWVYNLKEGPEGKKFKARLVAQGFRQRKGETYDEVFSPVVNFSLIRLFFVLLVSFLGWSHCQLDVKNAYLYAKLDDSVYMKQPQGFVNNNHPDYVCHLKKAIYGLKQSGRQWYYELNEVLETLNFHRLIWTNCVYTVNSNVLLLLYVDDIVVFGRSQSDIDFAIEKIKGKFDITILGQTRKLLGIEFVMYNNNLCIHQSNYIQKVYDMFKNFKIPISSLPIAKSTILTKLDSPSNNIDIDEMSKYPYRSLLGCLAFIAGRTRPDISFAVNILSQFQENPGLTHWNCLLKLLGYVKLTQNYKLNLSNVKDFHINCFSDSDFAANRDDRVSMGGIMLYLDESPIIWRTFKHKCVSLSTMESEYITLSEAAKEVIWIKRILGEIHELGIIPKEVSEFNLYCDNLAAIDFSNSQVENSRTKHIHVRYHFIRNLVQEKAFKLKYVNTKNNPADNLTKPLPKEGVQKLCRKIFVCN
jgi:hypothetical protein